MKIICAYTVNLDAVYNVNGIELAKLSGDLKPENQEKITRLEDLLSALLFCMKEGSGDELPIEREEVAGIIEGLSAGSTAWVETRGSWQEYWRP